MTRRRAALAAALAGPLLLGPLAATARPHNPLLTSTGVPLHWPDDAAVTFVLHEDGAPGFTDDGDLLALRRGVHRWEVEGAALDLRELHDPDERARTDWDSFGIHLLLFGDDFFPPGTGIIAVTPLAYYVGGELTGTIADGDILYNTGDFTFTTDLTPGTMDLEAITTHEAGHFVGFGHSGLQDSTMVPTASFTTHYPRTITADDARGVRQTYGGDTGATTVRGGLLTQADGTGLGGVSVWARDLATGRVLGQTSTTVAGLYELHDLPPGTYELSATPYDGPINAQSISHPQIDLDVGTHAFAIVEVPKKGFAIVPSTVLPVLAPGTPRLVWPAGSISMRPGQGVSFGPLMSFTGGAPGDPAASLTFEVPRAGDAFDVSWDGGTLQILTTPDTPPGAYDLLATNAFGADVYPSLLEIVPHPPELASVVPARVGPLDLPEVVLTGDRFHEHVAVHLGDRPATWVEHLDAGRLRVGVPALAAGTWDVVVIDEESGRESRLVDALVVDAPVAAPLLRGRRALRGRLDGIGEVDVVHVEGLAESELSVTVKGDKKDGLFVSLALRGPDGTVLLSNDSTHPAYDPAFGSVKGATSRIKRFPLPELGVYALEIRPVNGTAGRWTAKHKLKIPPGLRRVTLPKSAPAAVAPGAPATLEVQGPVESRVSGKLVSKDGAEPALESLRVLGVDLTDAVGDGVKVSKNGKALLFKDLVLPAFGLTELGIATGGGAGTLTGKLTVKAPKLKGVLDVDV